MRTRKVKTEDLEYDSANPRRHPEKNLRAIPSSLERFGQVTPLVVRKGTNLVIAGNGTLRMMRDLQIKSAAVVDFDGSDNDARLLKVVLNRSGELAEWDYKVLAQELLPVHEEGLLDLGDFGWDKHELDPLLGAEWGPGDEGTLGGEKDGDVETINLKIYVDHKKVIDRAIEKVRAVCDNPDLSESRALELICADFLAGPANLSNLKTRE